MNRAIRTVRNIVIIGVLFTCFLALEGLRLTPIQAHIVSEKGIHYGPSEIVKVFDHGSYQHLLCKYDKWISCNTVNKHLLFLWSPGSQPIGFENDKNKDIDFSWNVSKGVDLVYGGVNNPHITKIELHIDETNTLIQNSLYDGLFYFSWEGKDHHWQDLKIIGYNSNNEKVYETSYP